MILCFEALDKGYEHYKLCFFATLTPIDHTYNSITNTINSKQVLQRMLELVRVIKLVYYNLLHVQIIRCGVCAQESSGFNLKATDDYHSDPGKRPLPGKCRPMY